MAFLNFDGYKKSLAIRIASNYKFKARKERTQPANMLVAKTNSHVTTSLSFVYPWPASFDGATLGICQKNEIGISCYFAA